MKIKRIKNKIGHEFTNIFLVFHWCTVSDLVGLVAKKREL